MSAPVAEAHASISRTLDGILSGEGEGKYVICNWTEDDGQLFDLYKAAACYLEKKLGKPGYAGQGPVYPAGKGSDPGIFIDDYSHALEISWWKTDRGVLAALVSGHDADSLLCLTVVFRKKTP